MRAFTIASVFVLIGVILEVLAAFNVGFWGLTLVPLGLAFYMARRLVP